MNTFKTTLFLLAIPGSILIIIPANLIVPIEKNALDLGIFSWLALPFWAAGLWMLVWCAADFVRKGQGTPAPVDAPRHLVVSGLYRFVRNPMYMGVLLFAVGNVIWFGSPVMGGYALCLWLAFHGFVTFYEEPHLRKVFGTEYQEYCQNAPRWIPRLKRRIP